MSEPPPGMNYARIEAPLGAMPRPAAAGRSSRRVDAKWIFGVLFAVLLFSLIAVLALFRLTAPDQAEQTIAAMNQPILTQPQLRADLPLLSQQFFAFISSPGYAHDIYEDPARLREAIGTIPQSPGQNAGPGPEAGAGLGGAGSYLRAALGVYGSAVLVLGSGVHAVAKGILFVLLALLLVTGSALVFFSRGAGRIVSVGSAVAAASWAPLLALILVRGSLQGWLEGMDSGGQSDVQKQILADSLRPLAASVLDQAEPVFRFFSFLAVLLLAAAAIVYLAMKLREGGRISS